MSPLPDGRSVRKGRSRCAPLADALEPHQPSEIVSSLEPKAIETAALVAARLALPTRTADNLHETKRDHVPLLKQEEFRARVAQYFANSAERVFGEESADEAHDRFSCAVEELVTASDHSLAIVSHGTVMSLLIARRNNLDPYALWQSLKLPSFHVLAIPGYRLLTSTKSSVRW